MFFPDFVAVVAAPPPASLGAFSFVVMLKLQLPRAPSAAECARVAFQMSDSTPQPAVSTDGTSGRDGSRRGDGVTGRMYRLRQVHVANGGRIRASWQAVLEAAPLRRFDQGTIGRGSNLGLQAGGDGQRSPCGDGGGGAYAWAIVRTRGVVGEDVGVVNLACRVVTQGAVPDRSPRRPADGDDRGVAIDTTTAAGADTSKKTPSSAASSPWRWQYFDVETTSWLPGDVLSLWIRLDGVRPRPRSPSATAAAVDNAAAAEDDATASRRGGARRGLPFRHRPRVRAFQVGVVDDARSEEIARGVLPLRRQQRPFVGSDGDNSDRSSRSYENGSLSTPDCFFPPAFSAVGTGPSTAGAATAVRLDFAAMSPMNMAAAGGVWA